MGGFEGSNSATATQKRATVLGDVNQFLHLFQIKRKSLPRELQNVYKAFNEANIEKLGVRREGASRT